MAIPEVLFHVNGQGIDGFSITGMGSSLAGHDKPHTPCICFVSGFLVHAPRLRLFGQPGNLPIRGRLVLATPNASKTRYHATLTWLGLAHSLVGAEQERR